MPRFLAVPLVLAFLLPVACGKRGDPQPPLPRTPQAVTGLTLSQRANALEVTGVAPRTTTSGAPLGVFEIELLHADAAGDLEKVAHAQRLRVAPGETFHETWPLPPSGTSVRVAARAHSRGQRSALTSVLTLTVQPLPAAPTALTASLESGGVVLGWTGAPGLVYRRSADGKYGAPLDPHPGTTPAFRDAAVAPGQSWCYVVRAVAGTDPLVESAPSSEACVSVRDVFPPAAPTGVTALAAGGVVDVAWSPSSEADLAAYRVYRSDGGAPARIGEARVPDNHYRDEHALVGTAYVYTVTGVDKDGNESGPSAPAKARLQ